MKAVVIDCNAILRDTVAKICECTGHEVILDTSSASIGLKTINRTAHVVALIAEQMDGSDAFEFMEQIGARTDVLCLVLGCGCSPMTAIRLERSIARGFVDYRSASTSCLREAIERVSAGEKYYSPAFTDAVLGTLLSEAKRIRALTRTEFSVLSLAANGLTDVQIGDVLGIRAPTAKTHRASLFRKLSLSRTPQLMAFALRNGAIFRGGEATGRSSPPHERSPSNFP